MFIFYIIQDFYIHLLFSTVYFLPLTGLEGTTGLSLLSLCAVGAAGTGFISWAATGVGAEGLAGDARDDLREPRVYKKKCMYVVSNIWCMFVYLCDVYDL